MECLLRSLDLALPEKNKYTDSVHIENTNNSENK